MTMPALTLSSLENAREFTVRHIGPDAADEAKMLSVIGAASREALISTIVPAAIRRPAPMDLPAPVGEAQALARAARHRAAEPGAQELHRPGLPRHAHARRHPAQHPREPGLVHRLHALPGRDLAGSHGGAGQLPDHGLRPDRHGHGQRQHAGRSHCRRRGDDARQAQREGQGHGAGGVGRHPSANPGSAADPRRAAGADDQRRHVRRRVAGRTGPRRLLCRTDAVPPPAAAGWPIGRPTPPRCTASRLPSSWPPTCWP